MSNDTIKLTFRNPKELRMTQNVDSDFASAEDRRSVSMSKDTIILTFRKPKELRMTQNVDSDFASVEYRRNISGNLGTIEGCIKTDNLKRNT